MRLPMRKQIERRVTQARDDTVSAMTLFLNSVSEFCFRKPI